MGDRTGMAPAQRLALARLKAAGALEGLYLAGGSAVAWHLAHRVSRDLDLFGFPGAPNLDDLRFALTALPDAHVLGRSNATLRFELAGIPIDVVRYPYAPLEPPAVDSEGVAVASLRDLAADNLSTIARRGLRRDFWDLYAMAQAGLSLHEALSSYRARFGSADSDAYHVIKALTYFEDAERDPTMPAGMDERLWKAIKAFFIGHAPALVTPP